MKRTSFKLVLLALLTSVATAHAERLLVGGNLLNGNFNTTSGGNNFADIAAWVNIGNGNNDKTAVNTQKNVFDCTPYASISSQSNREHGLDTGHVLSANESFGVGYLCCVGSNWEIDEDHVQVTLFTTDDDTIHGLRNELVADLSEPLISKQGVLTVDHKVVYTTTAADVGKTLFVSIDCHNGSTDPKDNDFAILDDFTLSITTPKDLETVAAKSAPAATVAGIFGLGVLLTLFLRSAQKKSA